MQQRNVLIKTREDLIGLLGRFYCKKSEGFVFRGQASAEWLLRPKLFRKNVMMELYSEWGMCRDELIDKWFCTEEVQKLLQFCPPHLPGKDPKKMFFLYNEHLISVIRLFYSVVDIMVYNYHLSLHCDEFRGCFSERYIEQLENLSPDYWQAFKTFLWSIYVELMQVIHLFKPYTNKLLNEPIIAEDISDFDESHAQHYGVATSALDWTYNPLCALYFASSHVVETKSIIASYPSTHIALFCYKQLNDDSKLVLLGLPEEDVQNERAKRQEGCFTWLPSVRSYYLINNTYPSVETYVDHGGSEFILEKFIIELNNETIFYIEEQLRGAGIDKRAMGLDDVYVPCQEVERVV